MRDNTSEVKCYPFLMDQQFIECAESKLGMSGQPINEKGAASCCLYQFVERINNFHDDFIVNYLRVDNITIRCNITQDTFTAPLTFLVTEDNCSYEYLTEEVIAYSSDCTRDYLQTEIHSSYHDECYVELTSGLNPFLYTAAVFLLLLILFGAVLNCSVLFVYCKQRSLWKSLNLYLVNTILADTLMLVIVEPIRLIGLLTERWQLGDLGCKVFISNNILFLFVLMYTTTALSVERYHLIANCFQSYTADAESTRKRVLAVNLSVWILAIMFSSPFYVVSYANEDYGCLIFNVLTGWSYYWYILMGAQVLFVFVVPFSLILIFYIMTFLKITKRIVHSESRSNNEEMKSREKTAKMFVVIIAVYFVCHLPFNILLIIIMTSGRTPWQRYWQGQVLFLAFQSLRAINFCSNSIIIIVMCSEVRTYYSNMFHRRNITRFTSIKESVTSKVDLSTIDS